MKHYRSHSLAVFFVPSQNITKLFVKLFLLLSILASLLHNLSICRDLKISKGHPLDDSYCCLIW